MGGPACLAQQVGLGDVARADRGRGAGRRAGSFPAGQLVVGSRARQVGLDHQHGGGIAVQAQTVHVVDGADREPIHELQGHRGESGSRDRRHPVTGRLERREERQKRRAWGGRGSKPESGLGDQRERALRPDDQVRQRVAGHVLDVLATGPDDGAIGHHDLEREHGVARLAVLDAAQAAGVRPEVAADRAHLEARGIGRVEQPVLRDRGLERRVDDPGLGDDAQVLDIDLEDPVHGREGDRQRALQSGRASAQPGARATRHDGHVVFGADLHELGDLGGRGRQRDGPGQAGRQVFGLVASVGLAIGRIGQDAQAGDAGPDGVEEQFGDGARGHGGECRGTIGPEADWTVAGRMSPDDRASERSTPPAHHARGRDRREPVHAGPGRGAPRPRGRPRGRTAVARVA